MPKTLYTQDSDRDSLTDAQELALGTNPLSPDSDGDGQADLAEILSGRTATFQEMRQVMQYFLDQNMSAFTKAVLSVETQITSSTLLNDLYAYYMATDNIYLLDEQLRLVADEQSEVIRQDLTRLLDNLYRTGDGNEFISDVLQGQSSAHLVSSDGWQLGNFDPYSLETLDDLIRHQLTEDSDDYFGDLVHLALAQDKLDSRSQFLQSYMADLARPQVEAQRELSMTL